MIPTTQPLTIQIVEIKRTKRRIEIAWTQGKSRFDLAETDNPLPSFMASLDALAPLVATICHLPPEYAAEGLRVTGVAIGEHSGAPTVSLTARKDLDDASKEFVFRTPARMMAIPAAEGSYTPPLCNADVALVDEAIEQAKGYVKGERAQGEIVFEQDEDDEEDFDPEDLPLLPGGVPEENADGEVAEVVEADKPKRKRRKAKAATIKEGLEQVTAS
jgi:hypothetical protein